MAAVSGALIFIGYQLVAYGWSQVKGSNAGFFDILWPGRFKGAMPDGTATTAYGGGVVSIIQQGVTTGKISDQTGQELVSGNATVGLGGGTLRYLKGSTPNG